MKSANSSENVWTRLSGAARGSQIVFQATVFCAALLILFSRRPDALLTPQFYAEDGANWYVDAYQSGFGCLLMPNGGYLNTLSRVIGLTALLLPFVWAPLIMVLSAFAAHILPVNIFLSRRFAEIPMETRLLGSLIYLAVPNSFEIHGNTTNIQWHLALAGFLVLLSRGEIGKLWRVVDVCILSFCVLDGPLGMFLIPIALILYWKRRNPRTLLALGAMIPLALVQVMFILFSGSRPTTPNGANLHRLVGILGGQVFLSSILGLRTFIQFHFAHLQSLFLIQLAATLIGLAILGYAALRAPFEMKLFILYAAIVLTMALARPYAILQGDYEQWQLMQTPGITNRYWFYPMLAFLMTLLWMAGSNDRRRVVRYTGIALLAFLPIGVYRDWIYRPFPDLDFKEFAADFERAAPGTRISIPINPTTWQMQFTKR